MFTRRPVLTGAFLMLTATGLLIGFFFLGSIYVQSVRGWSALSTGLLFLPMAAGAAAGAHLGGHLAATIGPRKVAVAALALTGIGAVLLGQLDPRTSPWLGLLPGLVIGAVGIGAIFITATSSALANVREHEAGLASAVVNTFHEVGGAIGVALLSSVAAAGIAGKSTGSFDRAFILSAVIAFTAALASLRLVPPGKAELPQGMPRH